MTDAAASTRTPEGYLLFELDIFDRATFDAYAANARPILAAFGASLMINSSQIEPLEGEWTPVSLVMVKFPSIERARDFYNCDEYQKIIGQRMRSARSRGVLLAG